MSREFMVPNQIVTGTDALEHSMEYLTKMGEKALIVTGPHLAKQKEVQELAQKLKERGVETVVFSDIHGEPTDQMVEAGVKLYRQETCDFLIGFGGGSPLDTMKAIAVLSVKEAKITDYMGKVIDLKLPPMAAIPTTAGTGSETTQFTIITDTKNNIKMLLKGACLMPNLAIVDYKYTISAPKAITAATGLDALTHAAESYTSRKAQPMSDVFALEAVKKIFAYLPKAYKDGSDYEAREVMSLAAFEAGVAFNNASVTIVHGMSRPIGALFHVPHGISNAMLLEECFRFVADGALERFAALARAIGAASLEDSKEVAADRFLDAVGEICRVCEIPTLKEYGISEKEYFANIPKMAEDALASGSPANCWKLFSKEDVEKIYIKLWK